MRRSPGRGDRPISVLPTHENHSFRSSFQKQAASNIDTAEGPTDEAALDDSGELDDPMSEEHTSSEQTDSDMDDAESPLTIEGTFDDCERNEFLPGDRTSQELEPHAPNLFYPSAMRAEQAKEILGLYDSIGRLDNRQVALQTEMMKRIRVSNTFQIFAFNVLTALPGYGADSEPH